MQLLPETAARMAKQLGMAHETRQLTADPAHNAVLGAAYLAQMIEEFGPTVAMVAAGYNAGPGRVKRWRDQSADKPMDVWVESIPYKETRNYVQNVLSFDLIYQHKLQQPLRFMSDRELSHAY